MSKAKGISDPPARLVEAAHAVMKSTAELAKTAAATSATEDEAKRAKRAEKNKKKKQKQKVNRVTNNWQFTLRDNENVEDLRAFRGLHLPINEFKYKLKTQAPFLL